MLNTITKSGTNEVHGDAFYQLRHKELGLKDPVQKIASLETQHQWGGSVGGAIKKDTLFFFTAFERQDASTPRQVLYAQLIGRSPTVETAEALNFLKGEEKGFTQTNDALAFTARGDYQTARGHRLTLRYNVSDGTGANAASVGTALSRSPTARFPMMAPRKTGPTRAPRVHASILAQPAERSAYHGNL